MNLQLTRPLAIIDLESTGFDPVEDRIVEFAVVVLHPNGERIYFEQVFNPGIHIPEEASAVHGHTDESVKDKPRFAEFAAKIAAGLAGKDICGYNVRSMDLPMLDEELRRCNKRLDLTGVNIVDAFAIYQLKDPRDLTSAVRKFCGREHDGAHGALDDAVATLDVLLGQRAMYEDIGAMDMPALALASKRDGKDFVDFAGKLYRDADGDLRFSFGKKTRDIKVRHDQGFAHWMLDKDFPGNTKDALRLELQRIVKEHDDAVAEYRLANNQDEDGMPF